MTEQTVDANKVLVIWPPHIPSYFNAGHHLPLFQVAAYLRAKMPGAQVDALDCGALNFSWKELGDQLYQGGYGVIAIMNEFDALDGFPRLLTYVRELCPGARIVTFGRLSNHLPALFERYDVDAIVHTGDYEPGVHGCLNWFDGGPVPAGAVVRTGDGWQRSEEHGVFLDPDDWVLPDVREIPYGAYEAMYRRDENKFCGIPQRRELVVPAARGCPIGCYFCEVPGLSGRRDRRLSVPQVVSYIEDSFKLQSFEYVAFYAPTFTIDRKWIVELCAALVERGSPYPWKCATTVRHLDQDLLARMADSGCIRVSVGLETLAESSQASLPGAKRIREAEFLRLADWCRDVGIELNCFVIAGLPGETPEAVRRTVEVVRKQGARVRPTAYNPLHDMRAEMTEVELYKFNRQLLSHPNGDPVNREFYDVIFGHEPSPTVVMDKIPERHAR
jgi:anaerobic magnesium-protoporphyrin IX monomethyl ester cyclase